MVIGCALTHHKLQTSFTRWPATCSAKHGLPTALVCAHSSSLLTRDANRTVLLLTLDARVKLAPLSGFVANTGACISGSFVALLLVIGVALRP